MSMRDCKITDVEQLKRVRLLPTDILWKGNGVSGSEVLLNPDATHVFVGRPRVARLSNTEGQNSGLLLDFGTEIVGGLEIAVSGGISEPTGVKVRICFGESAAEAMSKVPEKGATNDHAVRDMVVVLPQWSQQVFGNTGYRFAYLELAEENAWIDIQFVRAHFTYRDIPYLGTFSCDNEMLNRIYDTCAYTVHLNMQDMLWDGVKRDRLVWIGDMYPEMLAIRTVFGDQKIIDDSVRFVGTSNPLPRWPNNMTAYSCWYILIVWEWYWYHGRKEFVVELKEYWQTLVEQMMGLVHAGEEELLREEEFKVGFFFDWPTNGTEEAKAGVYALFRLSLLAAAKLCELVEDFEMSQKCVRMAEMLKKEGMKHNHRKQIVAMMECADMIEKETAVKILTEGNGKGMSTFMSYFILSSVAKNTDITKAQEMLIEYYGAMLNAGATTFWEDFDLDWMRDGAAIDKVLEPDEYDIHGDNGRFCYTGFRHSLCHGWSAGPAAFLAEQVLGIQILEPGCKKVSVNPRLGMLEWAKGTFPTPLGIIMVEAHMEEGKLEKRVEVPNGMELVES